MEHVDAVGKIACDIRRVSAEVDELEAHVRAWMMISSVDDHLLLDVQTEERDVGMYGRELGEHCTRTAPDLDYLPTRPDVLGERVVDHPQAAAVQMSSTELFVLRRREVEVRFQPLPLRIPRRPARATARAAAVLRSPRTSGLLTRAGLGPRRARGE